jgi:hypothetical protein
MLLILIAFLYIKLTAYRKRLLCFENEVYKQIYERIDHDRCVNECVINTPIVFEVHKDRHVEGYFAIIAKHEGYNDNNDKLIVYTNVLEFRSRNAKENEKQAKEMAAKLNSLL